MKIPQPFPYQGSKRNLAPEILRHVPPDCDTFWEPFAGSAAMSIAVAASRLAKRFVINDLNAPLADLWQRIIDDPKGLADQYSDLWRQQEDGKEIEFYNQVRADFNRQPCADKFLFLLARCVKAAVRYNSRGEFNQSADPRRRGMIPATMRGNLLATSALFRGKAIVRSMNYADLYAEVKKEDVVYMDPPYQGVCRERDSRYSAGISHENFVHTLIEMNRRGLSFIVSYDGRTGGKVHGEPLPPHLGLTLIELHAGRSSQATLLGRDEITYESLYLSAPLVDRLKAKANFMVDQPLLV